VKSKLVFILLIVLITLICGCMRSVKIEEKPEKPIIVEPEVKIEEKEEMPKRKVELNYKEIDLKIDKIIKLEAKPGRYNAYSPHFSYDEKYIAFEAGFETLKKIYIYQLNKDSYLAPEGLADGAYSKLNEIYLEEAFGESLTEDFFESFGKESFNYEFSWFPESSSFIFTSNAGMGEYNIFMGAVEDKDPTLLNIIERLKPEKFNGYFMMTKEVKKDGQAKVSPDGTKIVFTSGRTGNGDLYLLDLISGKLRRLTFSEDTDLFPQWSPDGNDIVYTVGGKKSHDIYVLRNVNTQRIHNEVLIKWFFDDVLPKYSPDGKMISFYTTYNKERDPFNTKRWGIMIIPSDGSAPESGNELTNYFCIPDVIKDNSQATAWFPDSRHIIFAKSIDSDYNPIYIYDVENREERFVDTGTNINHDITVSSHGLVSFRAQIMGWDRIFIATTSFFNQYLKEICSN